MRTLRIFLASSLLSLGLGFYHTEISSAWNEFQNQHVVEAFQIEVETESLPDSDIESIKDLLRQADKRKLAAIVQQIQTRYAAKRVSIVRNSEHQLLLQMTHHRPAMIVDFDRLRFINEDGFIYGEAEATSTQIFPYLTGLKQKTTEIKRLPEQTYQISDSNQSIIFDALLLVQESLRYNVRYESIHYDAYRGFKAKLSQSDLEIQIGLAPFTEKLKRLKLILRNLESKGKKAKVIELDYQNKAFIQES